ncbi:hypothetical protein [Actinokineospora sp.]|uniref:hypothetical protein n=1 Tax=Actinokineospora sp. TaxID=1872133 RepID=UPI0040384629
MRKAIQLFGLLLIVCGISGTIDHLWMQPILGPILNFFNRVVIANVGFLQGYEVFANLTVSVLGIVVIVAADRMKSTAA